jgi:hypothetical protein
VEDRECASDDSLGGEQRRPACPSCLWGERVERVDQLVQNLGATLEHEPAGAERLDHAHARQLGL